MDADALLSVIFRRDLAIMLRYPFSVLNCRFCSLLYYIFVILCVRSLMHSLSVIFFCVYLLSFVDQILRGSYTPATRTCFILILDNYSVLIGYIHMLRLTLSICTPSETPRLVKINLGTNCYLSRLPAHCPGGRCMSHAELLCGEWHPLFPWNALILVPHLTSSSLTSLPPSSPHCLLR